MRLVSKVFAVCALFVSPCIARADGSLKDLPQPELHRVCEGQFSGAYAGLQAGFGDLSSKVSVLGGTLRSNDRDFTIGGHAGYNVQCGRLLYGLETDISYFGANAESNCGGGCGGTRTFDSGMNWFGTVRGRLGLVHDDYFLLFATAGLAYGGTDHQFTDTSLSFSQTDHDTRVGWTAGGGIEFMRDSHWSLRADALYVDLGSEGHTYTATTSDGCPCVAHVDWEDNFWVGRVGLTYHFGAREAAYAPLK